jgi:DNA-binding cell septation regulator SpoVG
MSADTASVAVTILSLERSERGRLLALASVEIEIAGVAFVVHGVRVIRTGPRSRGIAAPCYRVADGRLADAVTLPPELAIAVLDQYEAIVAPARQPIASAGAAAAYSASQVLR